MTSSPVYWVNMPQATLFCKQQVVGSTPTTGSIFPCG